MTSKCRIRLKPSIRNMPYIVAIGLFFLHLLDSYRFIFINCINLRCFLQKPLQLDHARKSQTFPFSP